jgi:sensor histidine kinase YesM
MVLLRWAVSNAKHEREKDQLRIQTIVNQLNPHFIKNVLNWLSGRVRKDEEAVQVISKFDSNISSIFVNSRANKAYHSLEAELQLVENYLFIQQKRFGEGFKYVMPSPDSFQQWAAVQVPLLVMQIHCENASEHGIRYNEAANGLGTVTIWVGEDAAQKDYIKITIEDDGVGRTKAKKMGSSGTQQGTKMLLDIEKVFNRKNKLPIFTQLYDDDYLTDTEGERYGTKVTILIPKHYNYEI